MARRPSGAVLVALVLLVGATSCAGGSPGDAADRRVIRSGDPSVRGSEAELQTIVGQAREVANLYENAASVAAGPCMRAAGFEYWEPALRGDGGPVVVDPEHPEANEDDPQARNAAYVAALSREEQVAYNRALLGDESDGDPIEIEDASGEVAIEFLSGGCLGEARAAVMPDGTFAEVQTYLYRLEALPQDVTSRVRDSPEYHDLSAALLACLRKDGVDAADVGADPATFGDLDDDQAEAARSCSERLDAAGPLGSLRDAAAAVVLEDNASLVGEWRAAYRGLVRPLRDQLGLEE